MAASGDARSCASAASSPAKRARPDRLSLDALPPAGDCHSGPATLAESVGSANPLSAPLGRQQEWPADGFGRVRVEQEEEDEASPAAADVEGTPTSALRRAEDPAEDGRAAAQEHSSRLPPGEAPLAQETSAAREASPLVKPQPGGDGVEDAGDGGMSVAAHVLPHAGDQAAGASGGLAAAPTCHRLPQDTSQAGDAELNGVPAVRSQHPLPQEARSAADAVVHVQLQQQALVQQKAAQASGQQQRVSATQCEEVPPTPVPLIDRLPAMLPQRATLDLSPAGSVGSCSEGGLFPHSPPRSGPFFTLEHAVEDPAATGLDSPAALVQPSGSHVSGLQEITNASQHKDVAERGAVMHTDTPPHAGGADRPQDQEGLRAVPLMHEVGLLAANRCSGSKRRMAGMEPESEVKNQLLREIRGLKHHDDLGDPDSRWLV